jgi:hypothetical protein
MLQCKTTHKKSIFVNEAGLSAERPDQTSFATHMHFIVQIFQKKYRRKDTVNVNILEY